MDFRVTYDGMADAAYIYLVPTERGTAVTVPGEEEASCVNLDFDHDGQLIGIEVLSARQSLPPEVIEHAERIG
jgi:uncharacterized protein YuzE